MQDVKESSRIKNPPVDLNEYANCYSGTLKEILSRHAPVKEKMMLLHSHAPWCNEHMERAKQKKRRVGKETLKGNQQVVNELRRNAKTSHYSAKIGVRK